MDHVPRYQGGDIVGETTEDGGRLLEILAVGRESYFIRRHDGDTPEVDVQEPLETAWGFEGCERATYLHERPGS